MLLLVDADWLDAKNIQLMKFFERWGQNSCFEKFLNEFHDHNTWRQTQTIAFSPCLLGTMVFPYDKGKEIYTRVVMVVDAILRGIGK